GQGRQEMSARATMLMASLALLLAGCGEDDVQTTNQRGMGGQVKPINSDTKAGAGGSRRSGGGGGQADPETDAEAERPDRPRPILTREDFSGRARDPFHNYLAAAVVEAPEPVEVIRKQRDVKLSEDSFRS